MKRTSRIPLGVAISVLFVTGFAEATYLGLSLESTDSYFSNHPNVTVRDAWNAGPVNQYDIYRLYANFNSNTLADRVNAISGIPTSLLTVNVVGGTFFNYVDGVPSHYQLSGTSPVQRAWDTWVTINGPPDGGSTSLTPQFGAETNNLGGNGSGFSSFNAGWFITPVDPQGQAVSSAPGQADAPSGVYRVLVAQFTVTQATASIAGNCMVNVNGVDVPNQTFFIPGPGALALLAMGIFASRGRRV